MEKYTMFMDWLKQQIAFTLPHPRTSVEPSCVWACMHAKSLQSCLTLCNSMDYSLPGSSVQGILQARILEWLPWPPPGESS